MTPYVRMSYHCPKASRCTLAYFSIDTTPCAVDASGITVSFPHQPWYNVGPNQFHRWELQHLQVLNHLQYQWLAHTSGQVITSQMDHKYIQGSICNIQEGLLKEIGPSIPLFPFHSTVAWAPKPKLWPQLVCKACFYHPMNLTVAIHHNSHLGGSLLESWKRKQKAN